MKYFSGLLIAFFSIIFAIFHLKQGWKQFIDPVAIATVFGGTLAVFTMTFPWDHYNECKTLFISILKSDKTTDDQIKNDILHFSNNPKDLSALFSKLNHSVSNNIIHEGIELTSLGFSIEKIEFILRTRFQQKIIKFKRISDSMRSLAKYPPAFGLLGTVLGLVSMMKEIATNSNAGEAGLRMSVALIATLYGILVANLILNPFAEVLMNIISREKSRAELSIQAIKLYYVDATKTEAKELLNSYLNENNKLTEKVA